MVLPLMFRMPNTVSSEFDIPVIVPFGRNVWIVEADAGYGAVQAVKMRTTQTPGEPWSVEHWSVRLAEPPVTITIKMNPMP